MQELNASEIDEVSGALSLAQAVLGWAVSTGLNAVTSAIGDFAARGGAPDYSRTTATGDMY